VSTRWGGADDDVRVSQFYYDYKGLRTASIEAENVEIGPGYFAASQTFVNLASSSYLVSSSYLRDVSANATLCYETKMISFFPTPDVLNNACYFGQVEFAHQSCDKWSTDNGQLYYWYVAVNSTRFVGLATADGHMQSTFLSLQPTALSERPFMRPSDQDLAPL
jgi:hypothetical protein